MSRILNHARNNLVAYIALFVALGGTSYAAVSLPAGSVGTKQLRNAAVTNKKLANGSITPAKFSSKQISGSIAMWARISATGTVIASKPRAQIVSWNASFASGVITWVGRALPPDASRSRRSTTRPGWDSPASQLRMSCMLQRS